MADRDNLMFTETEVAGYTIKSLSYGELTKITPELVGLFDKVQQLLSGGTGTMQDALKIIFVLLPDLTPVIAKVCNTTEQEIADLPATQGVKLASAIWQVNQEIIKDFFGIAGSLAVVR